MEGYRRHPHKSQRIWRSAGAVLLASVVVIFNSALDAYAAELCMPAMALVVSVQGAVELRRAKEANWQPAKMNVSVCPGDTVRVRERGRAALRLSNESVVRLDQKTTLTLGKPDEPGKDKTALMELLTGDTLRYHPHSQAIQSKNTCSRRGYRGDGIPHQCRPEQRQARDV